MIHCVLNFVPFNSFSGYPRSSSLTQGQMSLENGLGSTLELFWIRCRLQVNSTTKTI